MDLTSKSIVLTGGFGYVGGRIARALIASGAKVRISTRRSDDQIPAWARGNQHVKWGSDLLELSINADTIIHLAAPNEIVASKAPQQCIDETVALTSAALNAAVANSVRRFIYFSTVHVYGAPLIGRLNEMSPVNPAHPYAAAHYESERLVQYRCNSEMQTLILRLSNSFGAPADQSVDRWSLLVNDLCFKAASTRCMSLNTSGGQLRDFIPLTDVVDATLHFITANDNGWRNQIVNLTAGESMTVRQMAEMVHARAYQIIGPDVILELPDNVQIEEIDSLHIENGLLRQTRFSPALKFEQEVDYLLEFCRNL